MMLNAGSRDNGEVQKVHITCRADCSDSHHTDAVEKGNYTFVDILPPSDSATRLDIYQNRNEN